MLKHIKNSLEANSQSGKASLLDDDPLGMVPIWLQLTTKVHIAAEKRLKPIKVALPHPLNTDPQTTICLLTVDPQRAAKDLINDKSFPVALSSRITRVIGLSKLRAKWSQYEAQRKLLCEHDIFLADDRIITSLPTILGKTFYKSTTKRPIPVAIQKPSPKINGKRVKRLKDAPPRGLADNKLVIKEIEKALASAVIYLSPSTNTAIRIGYASWSADKLKENIEGVTKFLIENVVTKKWRGVKSIYIKGAETASLPIWLSEEIWVDEKDFTDENLPSLQIEPQKTEKRKAGTSKSHVGLSLTDNNAIDQQPDGSEAEKSRKKKRPKLTPESMDQLGQDFASRKEGLKKIKSDVKVTTMKETHLDLAHQSLTKAGRNSQTSKVKKNKVKSKAL